MNSKMNRLLTSLVLGLGLTLGLLRVLGTPFTRLPVARAADLHVCLNGCTYDSIQAALDDANDGDSGNNSRSAPVIVNRGQLQDLSNPIAENSITIDCTREGWESVVPYTSDDSGDGGGAGNVDWITVTMAHDCDDLYVRYEVNDGPSILTEPARYNLLMDVDRNRDTGYRGSGLSFSIGADVLVQGTRVFTLTCTDQTVWCWSEIHYYPANDKELSGTKRDIEYKIPISELDVFDGVTGFDWVAWADHTWGDSPIDINDCDFYPDGGYGGETGDFNTYTFSAVDLRITKTVIPTTPVNPGQTIAYVLAFSNAGYELVTGVVITDSIPVSVTNTSVVSSGVVITQTAPGYDWAVQDLAQCQGGIITITGVLSVPPATTGVFTNTATITTTAVESNMTDNSSSARVTFGNVAPVIEDATRRVAENAPNGTTVGLPVTGSDANGDPLRYSITAGNEAGVFAINSNTGQITVTNNATLDYETTPQYVLTVQVSEEGGSLTDTATVTITVVNTDPDLILTKSATPATATSGETITYTLTFYNTGDTATGVVIADTIPVSVTKTSVVSSGVSITQTAPGYIWAVQDLAQGEGGIITITGVLSDPLAAGTFTNTATIATTSRDSAPCNNSRSAPVTVNVFSNADGRLPTTVNYISTTALFPNPERGFYHYTETHFNNYIPLDLATLESYREDENITLIQRYFYLEDFVTSPISETYLISMTEDFHTLRDAGLKAVVRFAYTNGPDMCPPYGDTSKEWILTHIERLSESDVLQDNSDVIAVIQAGFIGLWGEWWYSDYFVPDGDWDDRREVLFALLGTLPTDRMVQLRTPRYKENIIPESAGYIPIAPSQAHNCSNIARVGHHNDCFLASASDCGTYIYPPIEYSYLISETRYVVMGGETGKPSDPNSDRLKCSTALTELEQFHWSFLNIDWYAPTLEIWRNEGCFAEIERRLGYRFILLEGTYDKQVEAGGDFHFSLQLKNEGFAAPFNPRAVELILRHTNGSTYPVELPDDPRFWLPDGTHTINHTISIPPCLPAGSYDLLLNLPDPEPTLRHRREYAIRLANENIWEEETGYNKLNHILDVQPGDVTCIYLPIILKSY